MICLICIQSLLGMHCSLVCTPSSPSNTSQTRRCLEMTCFCLHCVNALLSRQEPDAAARRALVDSMCELEAKMQAEVTALHITAAKLLLALGTHIVIPKPQAGKQRAGQRRLALGKFIQRLTDVSTHPHQVA